MNSDSLGLAIDIDPGFDKPTRDKINQAIKDIHKGKGKTSQKIINVLDGENPVYPNIHIKPTPPKHNPADGPNYSQAEYGEGITIYLTPPIQPSMYIKGPKGKKIIAKASPDRIIAHEVGHELAGFDGKDSRDETVIINDYENPYATSVGEPSRIPGTPP